jgi:gluconate 2-dehydrogenase gamma chain
MTTRRSFLAALAAGTAGAWLAAHAAELEAAGKLAAAADAGEKYLVLTAEQAALLDAATAQIVPSDDTPGAREAKVVRFIDRSLATIFKDDRKNFEMAMEALAAETREYTGGDTPYAQLDPLDQHAILVQFERSQPDAFGALRAVTMMGMFSNPSYGGNHQKSGWKMIGFEDRFAWSPPFGYYDRG